MLLPLSAKQKVPTTQAVGCMPTQWSKLNVPHEGNDLAGNTLLIQGVTVCTLLPHGPGLMALAGSLDLHTSPTMKRPTRGIMGETPT